MPSVQTVMRMPSSRQPISCKSPPSKYELLFSILCSSPGVYLAPRPLQRSQKAVYFIKRQHVLQIQLFGEQLAVGGGLDPPGGFQALHLGGGVGILGLHGGQHRLKLFQPRRAVRLRRAHSSTTPAPSQAARVSLSHKLTCTSPTCALPSSSMHSRL